MQYLLLFLESMQTLFLRRWQQTKPKRTHTLHFWYCQKKCLTNRNTNILNYLPSFDNSSIFVVKYQIIHEIFDQIVCLKIHLVRRYLTSRTKKNSNKTFLKNDYNIICHLYSLKVSGNVKIATQCFWSRVCFNLCKPYVQSTSLTHCLFSVEAIKHNTMSISTTIKNYAGSNIDFAKFINHRKNRTPSAAITSKIIYSWHTLLAGTTRDKLISKDGTSTLCRGDGFVSYTYSRKQGSTLFAARQVMQMVGSSVRRHWYVIAQKAERKRLDEQSRVLKCKELWGFMVFSVCFCNIIISGWALRRLLQVLD